MHEPHLFPSHSSAPPPHRHNGVPLLHFQRAKGLGVGFHSPKVEDLHCVIVSAREQPSSSVVEGNGRHRLSMACTGEQEQVARRKRLFDVQESNHDRSSNAPSRTSSCDTGIWSPSSSGPSSSASSSSSLSSSSEASSARRSVALSGGADGPALPSSSSISARMDAWASARLWVPADSIGKNYYHIIKWPSTHGRSNHT